MAVLEYMHCIACVRSYFIDQEIMKLGNPLFVMIVIEVGIAHESK